MISSLGQGGMGAVYRALDRELGREVALKLVLGEPNPKRLKRFEREAAITAALNHPNIVKLHAMELVADVPYLTYELVLGARTLDEVLPEVSLRRGVELLRDAARGLGYAHGEGVVHRDVKPQNLLVDEAGELKVADFGLAIANDVERLTRTGAMIGSPCYMAPELTVTREGGADPSTDVWSLGVILYEMLTGELPFMAGTLMELAKRIASDEATPPSRIDQAVDRSLEAVCLQALQKVPARRYADANAFADDLEAWLSDMPVTATPASGIYIFIRRHRRAAKLLVPVALGGVVLAGALAYDPTPTPPTAPSASLSPSPSPGPTGPSPTPSAGPDAAVGPLRPGGQLRHGDRLPVAVACAEGGLLTAGEDGRVKRWDLGAKRSTMSWTVGVKLRGVRGLPGSAWVAAGWRRAALGTAAGKLLRHRINDDLKDVVVSPAGRWVAVGGKTGRVVLLDRDPAQFAEARGHVFTHKAPVNALAFSADGRTLISISGERLDGTASLEGNAINTWSVAERKLLESVSVGFNGISLDATATQLAIGSTWGQVILYDAKTLHVQRSLVGSKAERAAGSFSNAPGAHRGGVFGVRFAPDGKRLYSISGPIDGGGVPELRGWDPIAKTELFLIELASSPTSLDVSSDGKVVVVGFKNGTASWWTVP